MADVMTPALEKQTNYRQTVDALKITYSVLTVMRDHHWKIRVVQDGRKKALVTTELDRTIWLLQDGFNIYASALDQELTIPAVAMPTSLEEVSLGELITLAGTENTRVKDRIAAFSALSGNSEVSMEEQIQIVALLMSLYNGTRMIWLLLNQIGAEMLSNAKSIATPPATIEEPAQMPPHAQRV